MDFTVLFDFMEVEFVDGGVIIYSSKLDFHSLLLKVTRNVRFEEVVIGVYV